MSFQNLVYMVYTQRRQFMHCTSGILYFAYVYCAELSRNFSEVSEYYFFFWYEIFNGNVTTIFP